VEDIFDLELERIIGQVRFRPTLISYSSVSRVAGAFETDFEEWRASKPDDVTLYSPKKKEFLQVGSDVVTYVNEADNQKERATKLIDAATKNFIEDCSIKEIRRIGFRNTRVYSSKIEFDELVDLIYKKFYSSTKNLKISADTPKDVVFVLDGLKNGLLNHVQIGPVKDVEARKYFSSNFDNDIKLEDNNLFVDIDVYTNKDLKKEETTDTLKVLIRENERLIEEYLKYIKS